MPIEVPVIREKSVAPRVAKSRKKQTASLMPAIVGALVIAIVVVAAPRIPHLVTWGKSFFVSPPPTSLGQPIVIPTSVVHPALTVRAGLPVSVETYRGQSAGKGKHFIGIPLETLNGGTSSWTLPVGTDVTMIDDLGLTHAPDPTVKRLKAGTPFGRQVPIGAGKTASGLVVFSVPNGRTVHEVLLSFDAEAPNVWAAPGS